MLWFYISVVMVFFGFIYGYEFIGFIGKVGVVSVYVIEIYKRRGNSGV